MQTDAYPVIDLFAGPGGLGEGFAALQDEPGANRFRTVAGEKVKVSQNLSGHLLESYDLPTDEDINRANEELIAAYWRNGFGGKVVEGSIKGWFVQDVSTEVLQKFLTKFRSHEAYQPKKAAAVEYLHKLSDKHPTGDVLLVSIKENGEDAKKFRLGTQKRACTRRADMWRTSGYRVASRGDEKIGLTVRQEERAAILASSKSAKAPSDTHYRQIRNKPLLMIHVLKVEENRRSLERVPAFGISFPFGHYDAEIEVVANAVWIDSMRGEPFDSPDEEEDYDE